MRHSSVNIVTRTYKAVRTRARVQPNFRVLQGKLLEGRELLCFVCHYIPGTENNAWHIVGTQRTCFKRRTNAVMNSKTDGIHQRREGQRGKGTKCLCPFWLLSWNSTDPGAYIKQTCVSHISGGWKSDIRVSAWSSEVPVTGHRLFIIPSHGGRGKASL